MQRVRVLVDQPQLHVLRQVLEALRIAVVGDVGQLDLQCQRVGADGGVVRLGRGVLAPGQTGHRRADVRRERGHFRGKRRAVFDHVMQPGHRFGIVVAAYPRGHARDMADVGQAGLVGLAGVRAVGQGLGVAQGIDGAFSVVGHSRIMPTRPCRAGQRKLYAAARAGP
ncbi:hypothetical protein D3C72_1518490 [compost metagenome]